MLLFLTALVVWVLLVLLACVDYFDPFGRPTQKDHNSLRTHFANVCLWSFGVFGSVCAVVLCGMVCVIVRVVVTCGLIGMISGDLWCGLGTFRLHGGFSDEILGEFCHLVEGHGFDGEWG